MPEISQLSVEIDKIKKCRHCQIRISIECWKCQMWIINFSKILKGNKYSVENVRINSIECRKCHLCIMSVTKRESIESQKWQKVIF